MKRIYREPELHTAARDPVCGHLLSCLKKIKEKKTLALICEIGERM